MPLHDVDNWVELHSGVKYHPDTFSLEDVLVSDIAVALSRLARYNGHSRRFYSVAEHTCLIADHVAEQPWAKPLDVLIALHHDDAEYLISDLVRPIKQTIPEFKIREKSIEKVVFTALWLPTELPDWLHEMDYQILVDERKHIMNPSANVWQVDGQPGLGVTPWKVAWRFEAWTRWNWLSRHDYWMKAHLQDIMSRSRTA